MDLAEHYRATRAATEALCQTLSPEDAALQSMEDASPAKWHLAHTSWFFETFVLEPQVSDYAPLNDQYAFLFNSYYNAVGDQYPRPQRGLISRPTLDEVHDYRSWVDGHLLSELGNLPERARDVVELGIHHEQQHQELILTDIKHLFSHNPLQPCYSDLATRKRSELKPLTWHFFPADTRWVGHDAGGFAFDNEGPRHRAFVEGFEIGSRLITNGEFQAFMADRGYERPELWLSDGWATVQAERWQAPLYWEQKDGGWSSLTLGGVRALRDEDPVCHVSFYEADAYARWACARLPTEEEWEVAAAGVPVQGNFVETGELHPTPAGPPGELPSQLFGDTWEWTESPYRPYPGYKPGPGALGEYNGKFMCNQIVLRGGSCITPSSHMRATYRNFFFPHHRWQFSGIRLARDAR
jgi:ergothioneine biosynthesis protein EgtB